MQIEKCKMQGKLHKTDWENLTFAIYNLNLPERNEGYLVVSSL